MVLVYSSHAQDECLEGDCINGWGKLRCDCGYLFEGVFIDGEKAFGTIEKEELIYKGAFKDDMAHGNGMMMKTDSSMYVGEFEFSVPTGFGTYLMSNGERYSGFVRENEYNGLGFWAPTEDSAGYFGFFQSGVLNGFGLRLTDTTALSIGWFEQGEWNGSVNSVNVTGRTVHVEEYKKGKLKNKKDTFQLVADAPVLIEEKSGTLQYQWSDHKRELRISVESYLIVFSWDTGEIIATSAGDERQFRWNFIGKFR